MKRVNLLQGDCLKVLKTLADNSVDSVVTDPPYGISFMNKKWDHDVPSVDVWKECLRVLKPGGHMLVACGTRTQHRMVAPIENAGFEIRDVITWLHGMGFPKSQNISIAIDKQACAIREVVGKDKARISTKNSNEGYKRPSHEKEFFDLTAPATDAAKQWEGWGTCLKPAVEFFTLCRKPLSESTIAKNVLKHGTGGINVDGCRVGTDVIQSMLLLPDRNVGTTGCRRSGVTKEHVGRFPANLILDEEAAAALDEQSGDRPGFKGFNKPQTLVRRGYADESTGTIPVQPGFNDSGGASRFFYCPKSSKSDRGEGNGHPTVKPTKLMEYLCRLITPPGGTVLDPFMGSGSTGVGALREGFKFIGIELSEEYFEICEMRIGF